MAVSPKRYGLDVKDDLELELRLRRIEAALEGKINSNEDSDSTSGSRSSVPQVTGLRVTGQTPGSVSIAWNPVAIPNLRRYQVEFSTSFSFATKQSFNENSTSYTFSTASETGGGGGTTFFARVRAVNTFGQTGPYSIVLNLTTGQAQTEDLAPGSVTAEIISTNDSYDNDDSGLDATNLQDAIDELVEAGFSDRYDSGQTALPSQDSFTDFTHGLGVAPRLVVMYLECTTADLDYSIGDVFYLGSGYLMAADNAGNDNDWGILRVSYVSSTVVRVGYATRNQASLTLLRKDGTNVAEITDGSWRIRVTAYA